MVSTSGVRVTIRVLTPVRGGSSVSVLRRGGSIPLLGSRGSIPFFRARSDRESGRGAKGAAIFFLEILKTLLKKNTIKVLFFKTDQG